MYRLYLEKVSLLETRWVGYEVDNEFGEGVRM